MPGSGVLWLIESGVLCLIEAVVVGLGLLSRKYCFLVAGVVKVQNRQGKHQFERLKFLDGPKSTIQVRQTPIASRWTLVFVAFAQLNENLNSINTRVKASHH